MAILLAMSSDDIDKTLKRFSSTSPTPSDTPASSSSSRRPAAATSSAPDDNARFLPDWFVPTEKDVVVGWARQNHKHAGNHRFRKLVEHSAPLYAEAKTKLGKSQVIAAVVEKVRRDSIGGGFVKKDFQSGLWFEIGDDKARDKVGHAIRRVLDEQRKAAGTTTGSAKSQSSQAKAIQKAKKGDEKAKKPSRGKEAPNLDTIHDFFEPLSAGDLHSNERNALAMGLTVPSGLVPQQKSDGQGVVPSFLFQGQSAAADLGGGGGGSSAAMNAASFGLPFQNSSDSSNFASSLEQRSFAPSSSGALFHPMQQQQQQQQLSNEASMANFLGQTSGLVAPLQLQQQMQASNTNATMHLPQSNSQFLPPSLAASTNAGGGDLQQASLAELLEEQQRINNGLLLQNRRLSLLGDQGLGSMDMSNNAFNGAASLASNFGPVSSSMLPSSFSHMAGLGNMGPSSASSFMGQMPMPSASLQHAFGASSYPSSFPSNAALPPGMIGDFALHQLMSQGLDDSRNSNDNNDNSNSKDPN